MTTLHGGVNTGHAEVVPEGDWLSLSALLTEEVEILTSRRDVIVAIAPGAAHGNVAMFDTTRSVIEINGDKLPGEPGDFLPKPTAKKRRSWELGLPYRFREKMEGAYGLLVHEASHADYTKWGPAAADLCNAKVRGTEWTKEDAGLYLNAAIMLEEIRVEAKAVKRTWWTRRWQRMAASQHLLGNLTGAESSRVVAATAATLVGGRVVTDIMSADETQELLGHAQDILGEDDFDALTELARLVPGVGDDDANQMLAYGMRWCTIVYRNPGDKPGHSELAGEIIQLAEGLGALIDRDGGLAGWTPTRDPSFNVEWRTASAEEKTGANRLRERLLPYFLPERSSARLDRVVPPGRLRGSVALRAAAQDSMGLPPAAEPWRFTDRRIIPVPPLRAGLVLDVSGSMSYLQPVSQGIAYRFGTALSRLPDALFRGALTGEGSAALQQKPGMVAGYQFHHGQEDVHLGVADVTARLDLYRRDAARLLIVVSDCVLTQHEAREETPVLLRRLTESGCRVLWLAPENDYIGDLTTPTGWDAYALVAREISQTPGVTWVTLPGSGAVSVRRGEASGLSDDWVGEIIQQAEDALVQVMTDTVS